MWCCDEIAELLLSSTVGGCLAISHSNLRLISHLKMLDEKSLRIVRPPVESASSSAFTCQHDNWLKINVSQLCALTPTRIMQWSRSFALIVSSTASIDHGHCRPLHMPSDLGQTNSSLATKMFNECVHWACVLTKFRSELQPMSCSPSLMESCAATCINRTVKRANECEVHTVNKAASRKWLYKIIPN